MKKWLLRIAVGCFAVFILLVSGLYYLLGTQDGAQILITQVEKLLDKTFTVGTVKGKILDRIELSDIRFTHPSGDVEVGYLVFSWNPAELLKRHVHILELAANNVSYIAQSQKESSTPLATPIILPDIKLPVTITADQIAVHNFIFSKAPGSDIIAVSKADIAFSWNRDKIHIKQLQLNIKEGQLQAKGDVTPVGNYPLNLTTTIKTQSASLPVLTILGSYNGDLKNIGIVETVTGDVSANVAATLKNILNDLQWESDITIHELHPATFSPEIPGNVKGKLSAKGNLKKANITSTLHLRDDKTAELNWDANIDLEANLQSLEFVIRQLDLHHPKTSAHAVISGTADTDLTVDLLLNWQNLQWPITGKAEYSLPEGKSTIKGTVDDFKLFLSSTITGTNIPETDITLTTNGNTKEAKNIIATLKLLDGDVSLAGDVQWTPSVKWNISSTGKHINPGVHYPEWPGNIDWLVKTNGSLKDKNLSTNVSIDSLGGHLREIPVSGTGNLTIRPEDIQIHSLQLTSGKGVFSADGVLSEQSDLQWKADVPSLSDFLPNASGQLKASGTVHKKMKEPHMSVKLAGSSLQYNKLTLEQIAADAAIDLSWGQPFMLDIQATQLKAGDTLIKSISAKGEGTREKNSIHIEANHELADITIALKGAYQKDKWQGLLDTLNIASKDFGTWTSKKSSKITASATAASIDTLCLNRENADLCIEGTWDAKKKQSSGDLKILDVPLEWLSNWFPDTIKSLGGSFSATGSATMQETLQAKLDAHITPGKIVYQTSTNEGSFPHEGMKLTLNTQDGAMYADFHVSVDSNVVSGNIQSPNLLQKNIGGKAKLDGKLFVDAKNFDLVEALVPEVQNLGGVVGIDFTILGTVEDPDINGKGDIKIANILIPMAGIDFSDINLDILAKNKEISLNGKLVSPDGELTVNGNATLDKSQGWPVLVSLKGNNFRMINLPEIKVFLSPDIIFKKTNDHMSLTGELTIPKAAVLLRELPKGTQTLSPDIVIIQDKKTEEVKSPFNISVKIALGDNVHFAGFGLNAYIDGQLSILSDPGKQVMGSGSFSIKQGSFRAYGQNLDIETGVISFPGGPISQPGINLRATRTVGDITAGIFAIGPARKPRLTTFSNPPMSESNVISYILTGSAGNDVGKGGMLSIGRQINNKLSVSIGTDVKSGESEFITRYRLSRKISIQTTTGTSSNAVDVFYTFEN